MAARSPVRSIAGPEVILRLTPIYIAMIMASVFLPNPGGPYKRIWSSASPLPLAASIAIPRFSLTLDCPIKSLKYFGLKLLSRGESSSLDLPDIIRSI
jgi:hypothetical protein